LKAKEKKQHVIDHLESKPFSSYIKSSTVVNNNLTSVGGLPQTTLRMRTKQPCANQGDREREHILSENSAENSFSHSSAVIYASAFVKATNGCLSFVEEWRVF
jgi:hypothetical protein